MTTGAASPVFVDTNVLVYANLTSAPFHTDARRSILTFQSAGVDLWINRQVLREYLAVVTRQTFASPLPAVQAITHIHQIEQSFIVADETAAVTSQLLTLLQTISLGGKQVHDANIVATMLVHGIERLLTHNVADFMRFSHLITVVPIVAPSAPTTS
jgi:predicted nucleic acid-binding protein